MAQTMSMGQAAGLPAAISLGADCAASDVDIPRLQSHLRAVGAVIDPPDTVARVGPDEWFLNRRGASVDARSAEAALP